MGQFAVSNRVRPSRAPATDARRAAVETLGAGDVRLGGGELGRWKERNRLATIPHVIDRVVTSGDLENFVAVADGTHAAYRGRYPFLDTDVYKTLEGVVYELAEPADDADGGDGHGPLRDFYERAVDLITRAQADDGYLNTAFQNRHYGKGRWSDLTWGHELYNLGHLTQAAVAASRQLGDDRLLVVARKFADLAVDRYGPAGEEAVDGHPEAEMALVELYRETGENAYLELATLLVHRRGRRSLPVTIFEHDYFQDEHPLIELPSVTGHAVRMGYLAAGATDVAMETGDAGLLAALRRLWDDMVATKLHASGGLGSRHTDEAIGDRYELPPERSYSETCAAIALLQWGWRMFLATGELRYLDTFEHVLYNAYAVGVSEAGTSFFYDNPLQRRPDHRVPADGAPLRQPWFVCPCCPPNVVRWAAQLQDYVAVATEDGISVLLPTEATISAAGLSLAIETEYPWDGRIAVRVLDAVPEARTVRLRVPGWADGATLTFNGAPVADGPGHGPGQGPDDGWAGARRIWQTGDVLVLDLPMPVRAHGSHPALDATRGMLNVQRGPLLYCVEEPDAGEAPLDDLIVTPDAVAAATVTPLEPAGGLTTAHRAITVSAAIDRPASTELYPRLVPGVPADARPESRRGAPPADTTDAIFRPYHLWGNRSASAMRVWVRTS